MITWLELVFCGAQKLNQMAEEGVPASPGDQGTVIQNQTLALSCL